MGMFGRILTTVTAVVAGYMLASRFLQRDRTLHRRPARVLIFSYLAIKDHDKDPHPRSIAAIATIAPGHFSIERAFAMDNWSFIASAASGNHKWLLLHKGSSGLTAVGVVDPDLTFRVVNVYPFDSDKPWVYQYAVVDGRGYLMLSGVSASKVVIGFAQVLDDGAFVERWRTEVDLPYPRHAVGLKDAHAWIDNDPTTGFGTVYIYDVKTGLVLNKRAFDRHLDLIVADGDRLVLFSRGNFFTETFLVDANHQLISLNHMEWNPEFFHFGSYHAVTCTQGVHLFFERYPAAGSEASVRVLGPGGIRTTNTLRQTPWPWLYVEPC